MSAEELEKLALLSKREREVLWLVCEGHSYEEISQKLYISIPTVKANMGRVYVKLGLDQLQKAERIRVIHQVYWPLLKNAELPPEASQAETPIPIPEPVAQMVDDDERSIIPYQPGPADIIEIRTIKKTSPRHIFPWVLAALFIGLGVIACVGIAYFALFSNRNPSQLGLELTKAVTQLTQVAAAQASQPTMAVVPTQIIAEPADNPTTQPIAVIVPTTPPSATAVSAPPSAPAIPLPFSDSFDNGPSSQWKVISGTWITTGGRYTIMPYDGWSLVALDDPAWKNYHIRVNINIPHQMGAGQGEIGVFVRINKQPLLGFADNTNSLAFWGTITSEMNWLQPIAGNTRFDLKAKSTLDIEVNGNNFIARADGIEVQRISLSGYDSGGIALGINCNTTSGCESFDDFQIDALP
jgi:hypothetical protein